MKWGASVGFLKIGSNMACYIKSQDVSIMDILNLLEFSHSICIYATSRIPVVNDC